MALPVDSFLRPKRKNTHKLKLVNNLSQKKTLLWNKALLFKASYFNWGILVFSLLIIWVGLLLLSSHLRYLAPAPLFVVEGDLTLEPLSIELRDRMGKEHAVVMATSMGHGLFYTAVLGNGVGLSSLSQRYKLSLSTLMNFNGLSSLDASKHLETIRIPLMDGLIIDVGKEKSLEWLAKHYRVEENLIRVTNYLPANISHVSGHLFIPHQTMAKGKLRRMVGETLIYPIFGNLVQEFGYNRDRLTGLDRYEEGVVFQSEAQTTVFSIADGIVMESGYHGRFGYYLLLKHQDYLGFYGNLEYPLMFNVDDAIKQNVAIGKVATSGRYGLFYFSLIKQGIPIDPLPLLR